MIQLKGIERVFQVGDETVRALDDINLNIDPGEYIAIMGPSGSGKSTLLNIIGLLDRPNKGVYLLDEVDTTDLSDHQQASVRRHKIGFVFQFFHLVARLSAADNVELPLILAGVEAAERKTRVTSALSALGLSDRTRHRPDQLSGGQRQRVAIARATIMQPAVVLADEPTGNLDESNSEHIHSLLMELNQEFSMTLVVVTHNLQLASFMSRRVTIADGKLTGLP